MDNGKGSFIPIEEDKYQDQMSKINPQVFKVGEIIEVRGSRLRVHKILKNKIIFKLLPQLKEN